MRPDPWKTRMAVLLTALTLLPAVASEGGADGPLEARLAARAALVREIDEAMRAARFQEARVGVHVVSVDTGEEIYARGADTLLNPASNVKIFTTAGALELLGPEFRFETEIWADAAPDAAGVVRGNLYLKGKGDPTITTERMFRLVQDLWHAGVRTVTGDVVVDESYFDDVREGPGWEQEHSDRAYIAPTGALSFNFNAVAIHVRPGARVGARAVVSVDPDSDYFVIDNRVSTGSRRWRRRHIPASIPEGHRQRILVSGVEPVHREGAVYYRRIDDPPYYFAETFKTFLKRRGVRLARGRVRIAAVPGEAVLLHRMVSPRLADVVTTINKVSNNHMAEMLLKTLGAEIVGVPGSWQKGVAAVEQLLEAQVGIPRGAYVMKNGSGLNDTNRFSPRQVTRVLAHMWGRFPVMPEFVSSLAIAGRDGTARYRIGGAAPGGVVRAKTGTLENVSALSGYVSTGAGEVLAFSILVNDHPGSYSEVVDGIDSVARAVVAFGQPPESSPPAPGREPIPASLAGAALNERVATYLALGRARDVRNVRFLRSALQTEHDPVLRAVVAEAVYLSDREHGGRLLLDSFEPTGAVLMGLRGLSHDLGVPTPVLSSLADLAAEGSGDAIRHFLQVAALAEPDDGLRRDLAEILVEVGRAAPDELVGGLVSAEEAAARAALSLLHDGLVSSGEAADAHPVSTSLRRVVRAVASEAVSRAPETATEAEDLTRSPETATEAERVRRLSVLWTQVVLGEGAACGPDAEACEPMPEVGPSEGAPATGTGGAPAASGPGGAAPVTTVRPSQALPATSPSDLTLPGGGG